MLSGAAKVLLRQASGLPQEPELVSLDLTDEGRSMLVDGLLGWGGPARCSESLAIAMGLARVGDRGGFAEVGLQPF